MPCRLVHVELLCAFPNPLLLGHPPQEALSSRQPTFDLGDEVASGRESLYCAQQRVPRNHLAHHTKRFSQAFVGQWPSGLQQVCGTEQK